MDQQEIQHGVVDAWVDDNSSIVSNNHAEQTCLLAELSALWIRHSLFFGNKETVGAMATIVRLIPLAIGQELATY